MSQKFQFARRAAVVLIIGGVVLGSTGCSAITDLLSGSGEQRDDTGTIVAGGDTNIFTLAVGDCLADSGAGDEVSEVPTVPCSAPHEFEAYSEVTIEAGKYPGDDVITQKAEEACAAAFEPFVGIAYADSTLDYQYYTPTQSTWDQVDDRLVSCVIFDTENDAVTGTLAGAAR